MNKLKITLALAALAMIPAAGLAQSSPSVSEIVVTKTTDTATSNLDKPANAEMKLMFAEGSQALGLRAFVDSALLGEFHRAARGTGKTLAAESIARDHFKSVKIFIRKGGAGSAELNRTAKSNRPIKELILIVPMMSASGKVEQYLEVKMDNVLVSNWSTSSSSDAAPVESLSLNYGKIKFDYRPQK